jgi:hypothetical protein
VLAQQPPDATGQRRHHLVAAGAHAAEVDLGRAGDDAVGGSGPDLIEDVGGAQHGLGGDACLVQATAPDRAALDDRRAQAELSGADGADVAPGPAPTTTQS